MIKKIYQFSAGPSALVESVLKDVSQASIDYQSSGLSIMEMSHRSEPIVELFDDTTSHVKTLLMFLTIIVFYGSRVVHPYSLP